MRVRIREFFPDDFESLWRIDQECFAPGIAYSRRELLHYLKRPGAFTYLAERDGTSEIAGFIVVEHDTRRAIGHVITLDVVADARRHGVGSALMKAADERLLKAGCKAVYLETAIDNTPAIQFYRRHGYTVLNVIPRYYKRKLDAFRMGKLLEVPA